MLAEPGSIKLKITFFITFNFRIIYLAGVTLCLAILCQILLGGFQAVAVNFTLVLVVVHLLVS